jgi:hypothetical protein
MHRSGLNQTACASYLISKLQLLANDKDWDSAAADLATANADDAPQCAGRLSLPSVKSQVPPLGQRASQV